MLFVATMLATSSECCPTEIAAAAVVSLAKEESAADLGLSHVDPGFWRPSVQENAFHGRCTPRVVALRGGRTLVTATGLTLSTEGGSTLDVRDNPTAMVDPEPSHPEWKRHQFAASTSLAFHTWRVGAWVRPDGATDIARYLPGNSAAAILLMTSAWPILGVSYLPLPDAVGGTLFFAQRLRGARFRLVAVNWSEAGLRTPKR
jgi:hypothetical protein